MKQRILLLAVALCSALGGLFTIAGCREDAIIKSSLTPSVDNIHTFGIGPDFNNGTDTVTMFTSTVYDDSVITSARNNGFPIFHALGWVKDPFAGTTAGSIYMQVQPTTTGFTLNGAAIDSLVLVLPYAGFTWGDTTVSYTQTINAYQINDPAGFYKDSTYYSFSKLGTSSLVGSGTMQLGPAGTGTIRDSVSAGGVLRAPHLRVRLSQDYINAFTAALAYDTSYAAFTMQLPGLYIAPDTTNMQASAMPYFRLNGTADVYGEAGIVAYAHDPVTDSLLVYQFPYNEGYAAHFNRITRNYTGTPAAPLLDTTKVQMMVLMQNGPGAAIDVRLPYIPGLPPNVIINKAELVFTATSTGLADDKFFGPARLYPQGINSSGVHYTIADRYPIDDASLNFIDGTPRAVVKSGAAATEYRINIPREVQQAIIQGYAQRPGGLHLRIGGTVNFPAAYRLVVGGRANSNTIYRPTINIIYSKQ